MSIEFRVKAARCEWPGCRRWMRKPELVAARRCSVHVDLTHRHRYGLMPVWTADRTKIESWWWCTDHPTGEWVKIEDDPDAVEVVPGWRA